MRARPRARSVRVGVRACDKSKNEIEAASRVPRGGVWGVLGEYPPLRRNFFERKDENGYVFS